MSKMDGFNSQQYFYSALTANTGIYRCFRIYEESFLKASLFLVNEIQKAVKLYFRPLDP